MVIFIPREQSFSERLGAGLGGGFSKGLVSELQRKKEEKSQMNLLGEKARFERENQAAKLAGEHQFDEKTYNIIKNRFGQEEADLYLVETEGGKTAHINKLLEGEERRGKLSDKLGISNEQAEEQDFFDPETAETVPSGRKDFDKGLTQAEKIRRQESRYKSNLPLYTESLERKRAAEAEKENLAILEDLSPRIGAIERLNINPVTGDLIIPGAASADAQRYVKTINDFTRNAKDSYGARVTNFDLQQFMKRLPTLANSEEGRRQIIQQLQIINDLNLAHGDALHNEFERHGGVRNIDYDTAQSLAEKKSAKKIDKLKLKFRDIGSSLDKEYQNQVKEFKRIVPKDHVPVRKSDGSMGYIPKENVKAFLKVQGNEVL